MRRRLAGCTLLLAALSAPLVFLRPPAVHGAADTPAATWNQQAAARYLDDRETWWQAWPRAQKDHGTVCISCHTVVPYAMARSALAGSSLAGAAIPCHADAS